MTRQWRRYELLLPLQFNDGRDIPSEWLAEAIVEIIDRGGAATHETALLEGYWRHRNMQYRDKLVRLVVDMPESETNREWMRQFKRRWEVRLEQIQLWMVSYCVEIE
jgi:hypothetical protein